MRERDVRGKSPFRIALAVNGALNRAVDLASEAAVLRKHDRTAEKRDVILCRRVLLVVYRKNVIVTPIDLGHKYLMTVGRRALGSYPHIKVKLNGVSGLPFAGNADIAGNGVSAFAVQRHTRVPAPAGISHRQLKFLRRPGIKRELHLP